MIDLKHPEEITFHDILYLGGTTVQQVWSANMGCKENVKEDARCCVKEP